MYVSFENADFAVLLFVSALLLALVVFGIYLILNLSCENKARTPIRQRFLSKVMNLQKLQLYNFKNYETAILEFPSRINVLVGPNGSGKTNLLDAIYFLALTKGAFQNADAFHIRSGADQFVIKGAFHVAGKSHEITCGLQSGARKVVMEDGQEYQKFSDHIGKYPVVLMDPADIDIINGGGESRRKFFDGIISQLDKAYLENLIQYNHSLKQRNGLLRIFHESGTTDWVALESYDHSLMKFGNPIYSRRKIFIEEFSPVFQHYFDFLVNKKEATKINYTSDLHQQSFNVGLEKNRKRDLASLRTGFGPHKDDFEFLLGDFDLKRYGSQGQQKSFVIALKLAQWRILKNMKSFKPILLMDDIFDKLDDFRIERLLELIKNEFGQLFITDARPERSESLLSHIGVSAAVFNVSGGQIEINHA